MSKHIEGPWSYYTEPQPNGCPIVGARGLMVCMLAHTVKQEDQRETAIANARLIAAAPDMLEALKTAEAILYAHGKPIDPAITAAIAKATGEK